MLRENVQELLKSDELRAPISASQTLADTERNRRLYLLLGGRSGRVHMAKDDETGEYIQVIHDGNSSPLLEIVYTFFTEPTSSPPAQLWALVMSILAILRILVMACETVDGPQFYEDRPTNNAAVTWMPNHQAYYFIYLCLGIPFLIDAFARFLVISVIFSDSEGECAKSFKADKLAQFLTAANVLSVVPFVAGLFLFPGTFSYDKELYSTNRIAEAARLDKISSTEATRVLFRFLGLLVSSHVLRFGKHLSFVKTVTLTLSRAGHHLVLPILFFIVFNIIAGVVFYFFEPCYDINSCPWTDVFDATFFSIVTMTTVGYGNQVPQQTVTRIFAVLMMIFGALFISMPLALIGNEYTDAVLEIEEQDKSEKALWANRMRLLKLENATHRIHLESLGELVPRTYEDELQATRIITEEDLEIEAAEKLLIMQYFTKTQVCSTMLEKELSALLQGKREKERVGLSSHALLLQAEAMSAIAPLLAALKSTTVCVVRAAAITQANQLERNKIEEEEKKEATLVAKLAKTNVPMLDIGTGTDAVSVNRHKHSARQDSDAISLRSGNGGSEEGSSEEESTEEESSESDDDQADQNADLAIAAKVGDDYIKHMQEKFSRSATQNLKKTNRSSFHSAVSDQQLENSKRRPEVNKGRSTIVGLLKSVMRIGNGNTRDRGTLRAKVGSRQTAFNAKLGKVLQNPKSLVSRVWMFLELPYSSTQAYYYRTVMISFIILSVAIFYLETMIYFNNFGSNTKICGDVLANYCTNKSPQTDPGCYVQTNNGTTLVPLAFFNNRYDYPAFHYVAADDPTDTGYSYYQQPASTILGRSLFAQPDTSETREESKGNLIRTCYKTHLDKYDPVTKSFPLLQGNATIQSKPGYSYPALYATGNDTMVYFAYPLNECHRFGFNFGTHFVETYTETRVINVHLAAEGSNLVSKDKQIPHSPVSCLMDISGNLAEVNKKGFQSAQEAEFAYGVPDFFDSRSNVHHKAAVCSRIECGGDAAITDGSRIFRFVEIMCFFIFFVDLTARMLVSDSIYQFSTDPISLLDFCALVSFGILLVNQSFAYPYPVSIIPFGDIDFSVLSSSPGPYYSTMMRATAVFRVVRLTRHFTVTQVLAETAKKCVKQILAMVTIFSVVLLTFSVLFYELEGGKGCYVAPSPEAVAADVDEVYSYCREIPESVQGSVSVGQRLVINKNGDISSFSTLLDCMWFCYVTATTTGYGDRWPITNGGQFINLFLMLAGSMYLSMPLTVAASTFYAAHQRYLRSKKKAQTLQKLTKEPVKSYQATSFTKSVQSSLQRLYEVLKAELAEMTLITNHLRRERKSYLAFDAKKASQRHKNKDKDKGSKNRNSDSSGDEKASENPPLAQQLQRSIWRLKQVLRVSRDDVKELAILERRRIAYLDELEQWKSLSAEVD